MTTPFRPAAQLIRWMPLWLATLPRLILAEVITDGSVGAGGAIGKINGDFAIPASLGTKLQGNLFHSFSQFNLVQGESATFGGPADVANVLARVTGGNRSSIDGLLRSTIPGANLFFVNPNGVVFGPNAKVDVSGSLVVSTANYLKLSDGGRFDASQPSNDILTSAPVSAFGFLSPTPAKIDVTGSKLNFEGGAIGKYAWFIGGDITFQDAILTTKGGRTGLISAASAGEVQLDPTDPATLPVTSGLTALGQVQATRSQIASASAGGGRLVIRAGRLQFQDQSLAPVLAGDAATRDGADIQVTGAMEVTGGSILISARATPTSANPAAKIQAGSILLADFRSQIRTGKFSNLGNSGNLEISTGLFEIRNGAFLVGVAEGPDQTASLFDAGSIKVAATSIQLTAGSGILTESNGFGRAGDIDLEVSGPLTVSNSLIRASALGQGDPGSILIRASSLAISGSDSTAASGIATENYSGGIAPVATTLSITTTGPISLTGGAAISSSTGGNGKAADIDIKASSLSLIGTSVSAPFINSESFGMAENQGNAGNTSIVLSGNLTLSSGATISASSSTLGSGGDIFIAAENATVDANGTGRATGISSNTSGHDITDPFNGHVSLAGNAGDISIDLRGALILADNSFVESQVTSDSSEIPGDGDGGKITILSDTLQILRGSQITSTTAGSGRGGDIQITSRDVTLNGADPSNSSGSLPTFFGNTGIFAETTASSDAGNAGSVTLDLSGKLEIRDAASISASGEGIGQGGNISVHAQDILISGNVVGFATGIFADTNGILADDFDNSLDGAGGKIAVDATNRLDLVGGGRISSISSTPGNGGDVAITARDMRISGAGGLGLTGLSTATSQLTNGGMGGDISVTVANALEVVEGGQITAESLGSGNAGIVNIRAGTLRLAGADSTISGATKFNGKGGSLDLSITGDAIITDHGQLDASTQGSGAGGAIKLHATNLTVTNGGNISTQTTAATSGGIGGDLRLDVPGTLLLRTGGLINASTSGSGAGGNVFISGGKLLLENAGTSISADTNPSVNTVPAQSGRGGNIALAMTESMQVMNGAKISSTTSGLAPSGNVLVTARDISVISNGIVSAASTAPGLSGPAGNINLRADNLLRVAGGGSIENSTQGSGNGGTITLLGGNVVIASQGTVTAVSENTGLGGAGGNISINAEEALSLQDRGFIAADTHGGGNGGTIQISSPTITIANGSSVSARSRSTGAGGRGGGISISGGSVSLSGQAGIFADTSGSGAGGDIDVSANRLTLDEASQLSARTMNPTHGGPGGGVIIRGGSLTMAHQSSISADSLGSGDGGDVEVRLRGNLTMKTGAELTARAFGTGDGGTVRVAANNALVWDSSISADTYGSGAGGSVVVNARGWLELLNGGAASATTFGTGPGGSVLLQAGLLRILGTGSGMSTASIADEGGVGGDIQVKANQVVLDGAVSLSAATQGSGRGGSIGVDAGTLSLSHGAAISTSATGTGDAGNLRINVGRRLTLRDGSALATTSSISNAGLITVNSGGDVRLSDSAITVQAFAANAGEIRIRSAGSLSLSKSAITAEAGMNGGNIVLTPGFLELLSSRITANAAAGNGGNITLNLIAAGIFGDPSDFVIASPFVFQSGDSRITASSDAGLQGTLSISAPLVDLAGSLMQLEGDLVAPNTQFQERCAMRLDGSVSTFLVVGRGSVEASPDEFQLQIESTPASSSSSSAR